MSTKTENELIQENYGLVVHLVEKYKKRYLGADEDLIQVGLISLLKAIRKFDSTRAKLSTYAWWCVSKALSAEIKKSGAAPLYCSGFMYEVLDDEKPPDFWEILPDNLEALEIDILRYRLNKFTYKEIGDKLGYSGEWVRQKLKGIAEKIKSAQKTNTVA